MIRAWLRDVVLACIGVAFAAIGGLGVLLLYAAACSALDAYPQPMEGTDQISMRSGGGGYDATRNEP